MENISELRPEALPRTERLHGRKAYLDVLKNGHAHRGFFLIFTLSPPKKEGSGYGFRRVFAEVSRETR